MTFAYPGIDTVFSTESNKINCIVIENKRFYADIVNSLSCQCMGDDGDAIVTSNGSIVDFSNNVDILTSFFPFDLNRKNILSKIIAELDKQAQSARFYLQSSELLSLAEKHLNDISADFPLDLTYKKLSISSLIKAAGVELVDDSSSLAEKVLNYMEIVREFDGNKLFFMINLRAFIDDCDINEFMRCVKMHQYDVIMFENCSYPVCEYEKRFTVDSDLCCF